MSGLFERALVEEVLALSLVEGSDAVRREPEGVGVLVRQAREGLRAAIGAAHERLGTAPIEALREPEHGCIPFSTDGVEDLADGGLDGVEVRVASAIEPPQRFVGFRRAVVYDPHPLARPVYHVKVLLGAFGCLVGCPSTPMVPAAHACPEGTTVVLGACVPFDVADAYCGKASRPQPGGGCARVACPPGEALELDDGLCLPVSMGRSLLSRQPDDDRVPTCTTGTLERASPTADLVCAGTPCGRGEHVLAVADAGPDQDRCVPLPPCAAGEIFDEVGKGCRRVVRAVVDVGTWARLALGTDGGEGANAFCAPVRALDAPSRFRVRLLFPDNDVTQVSARLDPLPPTTPSSSDAAERSIEELMRVLRDLGGTSNAASLSLEVACTPSPKRVLPTLEAPKTSGDAGR